MVTVTVRLFLVSAIFISKFMYNVNATPEGDDRDVLIAFKESITADYNNSTQDWDPSLVSPCTWFHVTCDSNNRVTEINLGGYNLIASLVPELGQLDQLTVMDLYSNALIGLIPPEIGNLTNLKTLRLNDNFLSGSIPSELKLLKNLKTLELQDNNLNGTVPAELENNFGGMTLVNLTNNEGSGGLKGKCTETACVKS